MIIVLAIRAHGATLSVPTAYNTLNDALSAANDGDTIEIGQGSYCLDQDVNADITMRGMEADPRDVVLAGDCNGDGRVLELRGSGAVTIENLTVDGESSERGILAIGPSFVTLVDVHVVHTSGSASGAGLYTEASVECRRCIFCDNVTTNSEDGGAIRSEANLLVVDSVFLRNTAGQDAGAIDVRGAGTNTLLNNTFVGNSNNGEAMAIRLRYGDNVLYNNIFVDHNGDETIILRDTAASLTASHNLFFDDDDTVRYETTSIGTFQNTLTFDPELTDLGGNCDDADLSLVPGSPAIGAGSLNGTSTDLGAFPYLDVDNDGDGSFAADDCDDTDNTIFPGAPEICNSVDDDCDNLIDDADPSVTGGQSYYLDADVDGYGAGELLTACLPANAAYTNDDCDDSDENVHPGAAELCTGEDDDCDGLIDDDDPDIQSMPFYYDDTDQDGFGAGTIQYACSPPAGSAQTDTDCDDNDSNVYPNATELCNGYDDDCDGGIDSDDDDVQGESNWFLDTDGDTYGDSDAQVIACFAPALGVSLDGDCDDSDPSVFPGAPEQCNGIDDDCDQVIDNEVRDIDWYADSDGDGFGDNLGTPVALDCVAPGPYTASNRDDCNDADDAIHPGAVDDQCDGVDDNCDGVADDEAATNPLNLLYVDDDLDGFGDQLLPTQGCPTAEEASRGGDCDDANDEVNPDALEICNDQTDNDCDPTTSDVCDTGTEDTGAVQHTGTGGHTGKDGHTGDTVIGQGAAREGCGCATPSSSGLLWLALAPLALTRRR